MCLHWSLKNQYQGQVKIYKFLQGFQLRGYKGAVAGSLILNKRFEDAVKNIVGEEEFLELKKTEGFADAVKTFDREVKPAFTGEKDQAWNVNFTMGNLQDDPANNIQANCLRLKQ